MTEPALPAGWSGTRRVGARVQHRRGRPARPFGGPWPRRGRRHRRWSAGPAATQEQFDFTGVGARFAPVEIPASPTPADARAVLALRRALAGRPGRRGARARPAGRVGRGAGPSRRPADRHLAQRGARRWTAGRHVPTRRSGWWSVAPGWPWAPPTDLVRRAAALGATDARLAPVAAPTLPAPRRRPAAVRAEFGVRPDQPLILSVGRLHPQKRYDVLIDAAARWRTRTPPPVVVIAGSGPAYLPLAARTSAARAPVTLLGHRTDVADLLAGADLAVVTSDWEARQLFAQEALRAGVPLVATAVGGLAGAGRRRRHADPRRGRRRGRRGGTRVAGRPGGRGPSWAGGAPNRRRRGRPRRTPSPRWPPSTPSWPPTTPARQPPRAPTPPERDTGDVAPNRPRPADRARGGAGCHRPRRAPDAGQPATHRRLRGARRGRGAALGGRRSAEHPDAVADGPGGVDRLAVGAFGTPTHLPGGRLADAGRGQLRRVERQPVARRLPGGRGGCRTTRRHRREPAGPGERGPVQPAAPAVERDARIAVGVGALLRRRGPGCGSGRRATVRPRRPVRLGAAH